MSSFTPHVATPQATPPDPSKHVNYNLGMVLGVDDFTQEFAYLSGRDQWLARDLLGYGTVWGLRVFTEMESRRPRLVVDSGVAVSPYGQLIRVPAAQCAYWNDWLKLETTKTELVNRLGSPPSDRVRIYVALCYRDCPTDEVPIPGEPCRSEEDSMMPSRLTDDFVLELRFTPPDQREEDALRDFVTWLSQIEISDKPGRFPTLAEFLEAVRHAAQPTGSPPESPSDFMFGSPPVSLRIPSAKACEYLRAAFRVWTTELRPRWRPTFRGGGCTDTPLSQPDPEACVMLAEVVLPLTRAPGGDWAVDDRRPIVIDEGRRPFLLHLRLLQEWLLCGRHQTTSPVDSPPLLPNLAGDVTGAIDSNTVVALRNVNVAAIRPTANQVLTFQGGQWQPANVPPAPGGEFVAHPPGVGSYAIVAAGIVSGGGSSSPVYNGLKVDHVEFEPGSGDLMMEVSFLDYVMPDDTTKHQYIVKALPVIHVDVDPEVPNAAFVVYFDSFAKDFFVLRLILFKGPRLTLEQANSIKVMIEVSRYPYEPRE